LSRTALGVALLVAVRLGLDASRLLTDPGRYWNWEEAHSAGVAWFAGQAGLWDQILALQYKSFCGGCTVLAGVATPVLAAAGDSFLAWKAIALAWTGATLVAVFLAVDRGVGRAAAWGALGLLAVPPLGLTELSLMLWGNHAESALLVAVAFLLAAGPRPWLLGLWLGMALWFSRTTAYAMVVLVPWQLWRWRAQPRAAASLLVGLGAGLLLLLVPAAQGDAGYYAMGISGNLAPQGWGEVVRRLGLLARPDELSTRLFLSLRGVEGLTAAWLAGVGLAALLAWWGAPPGKRGGVRAWVLAALAFALFFALAGFTVPRSGSQARVLNIRYHAPWFFVLTVVAGAGVGLAWARGGGRRLVAGLAALLVLVPVGAGWAQALGRARIDPGILSVRAVSPFRFAWIAVWRLSPERLARARGADPLTEAWLRRLEGYAAAAAVRQGRLGWDEGYEVVRGRSQAVEAFAQGLTEPAAGWQGIASLNAALRQRGADAAAFGRGAAWNLGFAGLGGDAAHNRRLTGEAARARAEQLVGVLRSGLAPDEPCWTCAAVGPLVMQSCRVVDPEETATCLLRLTDGLPDAGEVLHGAGAWCMEPGMPAAWCERVDAGASFAAGRADPMAGLDRAFLVGAP